MKILKIIAIVLLSLLVLLVLISFLLPRQVSVSRATSINASAFIVYPLVSAPTNWQKWSVWNQRDPNMVLTYSGGAGVGAKWSWQSKTEGNGEMEIVSEESGRKLDYQLKFADWGMTSNGTFKFEQTNDVVTQVTWSMNADMGANPLFRYLGLFMDRMVGKDFESGLAGLKAIAEKNAVQNPLNSIIAPPTDAPLAAPATAPTEPASTASPTPATEPAIAPAAVEAKK